MTKRLLTLAMAAAATLGFTLRANYSYTFGELNRSEESCTLLSWSGTAPANGQMVIPNYYTDRTDGKSYCVTKIADHALDNIPDVTEIVIPSNVKYIGDADYLGTGGTNNFYNCPKLTKFTVDENNKAFHSYLGVLRQRYSFCLQRVPTLWETTDGKFVLEISYQTIAPGAFAGNTTIQTVAFNSGISWTGDPGFSSMPNLSKYRMEGEEALEPKLKVYNNIAYTLEGTKVLSCPPAQTESSLTLLAGVKEIGDGAFANVRNLTYAGFSMNNLKIGEGAFRNCTNLTQVYIGGNNCTLGKACFKGCSQLSDFNWSDNLNFTADSIFAGCGFTEITFPECQLSFNLTMGHAMFDGCQSLKKVDMSKVTGTSISGHVKFKSFVTSNCPNLTTFIFPQYTDFLGTVNGNPNMGFNSNIENIVLTNFTFESADVPAFEYKDQKHYPKVYYSPLSTTYDHPLKFLFGFSYPGQYDLTVYSAVNDVTFGPPSTRNNWIVPNATYYVPGGCYSNYASGFNYNCKLNESYFLHNYDADGTLVINFETFSTPSVSINEVYVNNQYVGYPNAKGTVNTGVSIADAKTATTKYTVNSFPMTTSYASISNVEPWAGVENVAADASSMSIAVANRVAYLGSKAEYALYDLTGQQLLSGNADSVDMHGIPAGIYLIKATDLSGNCAVKKISLR